MPPGRAARAGFRNLVSRRQDRSRGTLPNANILNSCLKEQSLRPGAEEAVTTFHGRPLCLAPGVASTLNLPFEGSSVINRDQPAGVAFHMLDDDGRLITHYRTIPST